MTIRVKILAGLLSAALAVGGIAFLQEQQQLSIFEGVRGSLAVGDSKEKVEQVLRDHGLAWQFVPHGDSYTAQVWFHFRPDVSLTIALNEQGRIAKVFIKDLAE